MVINTLTSGTPNSRTYKKLVVGALREVFGQYRPR